MVQLPFQSLVDQALDPTAAFPLSIEERGGDFRAITLRGRTLPHRGTNGSGGGVAFPSELRINTHYYPGNPVGDAQVLGAMWGETLLNGRWRDNFLQQQENQALLANFPPLTPAGAGSAIAGGNTFASSGSVPSDVVTSARALRDAFYMLQRGGQLLRLTWGSIARFGFIKEFTPTHSTEKEIYWAMTFQAIGDTDAPEKIQELPSLDPPGLLAAIAAALKEFLNTMNTLLAQIYGNVQAIQQKITQIGTLVTNLIEVANQFVNLAFAPRDLYGTIEQQIASIKAAIQDLVDTVRSIPAAYAAKKGGADQEQVNETEELVTAIISNALALGLSIVEISRRLALIQEANIRGVAVVQQGQTLRDIAREFDMSPDSWTLIAEYNGFTSSVVPAGTVVRVPANTGAERG